MRRSVGYWRIFLESHTEARRHRERGSGERLTRIAVVGVDVRVMIEVVEGVVGHPPGDEATEILGEGFTYGRVEHCRYAASGFGNGP
jgi:hypothetical protein